MSGVSSATAPLAVFGDLDADLWGVILGGAQPLAAVGSLTGADVQLRPAELDTSDDDAWTLIGAGSELRVQPADATATSGEREQQLGACRVSGSVQLDASRREFDVGGVRCGAAPPEGIDSLRMFAAWFPAGHEIGMISARPKYAANQERDRVEVIARGEEHPLVIDPRLSTTYDGAGAPLRVGLELWLGDDPDGEAWPRRVAGSSTGSRVAGPGVGAYAFRCVTRGEPGAGVYLLLAP
jgi:hypothetical protein